MITKKNLIVHELIGLNVKVSSSRSRPYVGIEGTVLDETLNTLVIECAGGQAKRIPKKGCIFEFTLPSGEKASVKGDLLLNLPENRLKRGIHKI
ncbi:MAG: ribonuclease P protein component 1 [Candidatus Micrarchaeia archaeon]